MFGKAIETLKSKTGLDLNPTQILSEIKLKREALTEITSEITAREKERISEKVVEALLKGQELGNDADTIRERVKARLFEQKDGDRLFVDNLKYINEVLLGSLPKSFDELTSFRSTLAHKLVDDARGDEGLNREDSGHQASGRSRSGNRRRGNRRPSHQRREPMQASAPGARTGNQHVPGHKQESQSASTSVKSEAPSHTADHQNAGTEVNS